MHLSRDFSKRSTLDIKSLLFKTKFRTFLLLLWLLFFLYCGYYYFLLSSITTSDKKRLQIQSENNRDSRSTREEQVTNKDNKFKTENPTVQQPALSDSSNVIPIVIFTYQRAEYLRECIETLLRYIPNKGFHIYVSQDGFDEKVKETVDSFGDKIKKHFQRERNVIIPDKVSNVVAYYSIAQHYKFGIDHVFAEDVNYDRIIIMEEDLRVAPDFFEYFTYMSPLLNMDTSLFCISAWNDNGMKGFVKDPAKFYRSDFFPGLGWMMRRKLWEDDFGPKWPLGFWDDWIREGVNRKGRACVRPEISRTYTFGFKGGASSNQFANYLSDIVLNTESVDWNKIDINSLVKSNYDEEFIKEVKSSTLIKFNEIGARENEKIRLEYSTSDEYMRIAREVGIMADVKAGVPRGAYLGTVTVRLRSNTLYITTPSFAPQTYTNLPPYKI
ncbi:hypothetical protein C9374_006709 [Naegleria lovaniensis]|uniref:alpha-1,3-mannosyl-glycoprotein 2-beta-N-acetylglucosaminyltransferase n=1 Tax=Naegleria lovaniensis TaxID=51637 RepID=A0AA88GLG6_NAELO|nr:uncharacterized protein C9374_006709 [Naegleria lovaniensis]KAG2379592.1 hypothetical protein C9374_006709 [Naegleria lovaniensis]